MTLQLRQRMLILYQRLFLISLFYSGRSDHPLLAIYTSKKPSKPITSPYFYIILCFLLFINKLSIFYLHFQKQATHLWCVTCFVELLPNYGFRSSPSSFHGFAVFCNRYNGFSVCGSPPDLSRRSQLHCQR